MVSNREWIRNIRQVRVEMPVRYRTVTGRESPDKRYGQWRYALTGNLNQISPTCYKCALYDEIKSGVSSSFQIFLLTDVNGDVRKAGGVLSDGKIMGKIYQLQTASPSEVINKEFSSKQ